MPLACSISPQHRSRFCFFHRRFPNQETTMQWTTPAYTDLRFGFEITMYIANR
jgi:pyrroloquinoline quinone biosynthesis protein A